MKICIYGAGAIGILVGARLAATGRHEVSAVSAPARRLAAPLSRNTASASRPSLPARSPASGAAQRPRIPPRSACRISSSSP